MADDKRIDTLNSLLRGELAAAETYRQSIEHAGDDAAPLIEMLRSHLADHESAADWLRGRIMLAGGEPAERSGPWGAFARALGGVASLAGERPSLHVLAQGERRGLADYGAAITRSDLDERSKRTLQTTFVPKQQRHIAALDEYLDRGQVREGAKTPTDTGRIDGTVEAILGAKDLTREQKIERLQAQSYEARELQVATEEGMSPPPGAAPLRLGAIARALSRLGVDGVATDSKH